MKGIKMRSFLLSFWIAGCVLISANTALAQVNKIKVEPTDFGKWSELANVDLSPNGKWIKYQLKYDLGKDTMVVMEVETRKKYYFSSGKRGSFSENQKWFYVHIGKEILLLNLNSGEQKTFCSVNKASFMAKGRFLLMRTGDKPQYNLLIRDLEKGDEHYIHNVKEFMLSPNKKAIGFISEDNRVGAFWLETTVKNRTLLAATALSRENLVWNADNNAMAFMQETKIPHSALPGHKIYFLKNISPQQEEPIIKIISVR